MKLIEHVYAIKDYFTKGPAPTETTLSSRYIAHLLNVYRSRLLYDKIRRRELISELSYQKICVPLEYVPFSECCDLSSECYVLKSKKRIPKVLNIMGNDLKVTTLSGALIGKMNPTEQRYYAFSKLPLKRLVYSIEDGFLVIYNNKDIEMVNVTALFDDPSSAYLLECESVSSTCEDPFELEFPIDTDLISDLYRMVIDHISRSYWGGNNDFAADKREGAQAYQGRR